jgi:predicted DNA-binding transcriptional regulator AlpA
MVDILLRKKEVCALVGRDFSTIWRMIKAGNFPEPLQLNPGSKTSPIAWPRSEIEEWQASRRRGLAPPLSPKAYERRAQVRLAQAEAVQARQAQAEAGHALPDAALERPKLVRVKLIRRDRGA